MKWAEAFFFFCISRHKPLDLASKSLLATAPPVHHALDLICICYLIQLSKVL